MIDRLSEIEARYEELSGLMSSPEVATNPADLQQYGRELSRLEPMVTGLRRWRDLSAELAATRQMTHDADEEVRVMVRGRGRAAAGGVGRARGGAAAHARSPRPE